MFSFLTGSKDDPIEGELWQDREIRFDCDPKLLTLRKGEIAIDSINSVEDTKGNNGERGSLAITNLRMIWQSHKNARTNLSIGYSSIQSLTIKSTQSKLKGQAQALYVMTRLGTSRFEFIFTSLVKASPRLFTTVQAVFRAYETSRLYRDLKLRGALVKERALIQLPHEKIFSKMEGVWNLSSEQGNLGVFYATNVRLVWHASLAENFNVSIPFVQMKSVRLRDSKFGRALVIQTSGQAGGYLLGFRIDPPDALEACFKELTALRAAATASPLFGIDYAVEEKPAGLEAVTVPRTSDDVEIVGGGGAGGSGDDAATGGDAFAAYFAEGGREGGAERGVVFSPELGLAIEAPPEGLTVEKLWAPT